MKIFQTRRGTIALANVIALANDDGDLRQIMSGALKMQDINVSADAPHGAFVTAVCNALRNKSALANEKTAEASNALALANDLEVAREEIKTLTGALAGVKQTRAEFAVDLAIHKGKLAPAQRDTQISALTNSTDFYAAAKAMLEGPAVVKLTGQDTRSGKQGAALSDATVALQNEYQQAFTTEMVATGNDPVKAHKNVMTLPKYAGLAEKLMPAKF